MKDSLPPWKDTFHLRRFYAEIMRGEEGSFAREGLPFFQVWLHIEGQDVPSFVGPERETADEAVSDLRGLYGALKELQNDE